MTFFTNTAEGGSDGLAATVDNSGGGSGSPFTAVAAGTSAGLIFRAADAYRGSLCYQQTMLTSATTDTFDLSDPTPADSWAIRVYFRMLSYPSATVQGPLHIRSTANAALAQVRVTATGQIQLYLGTTTNTASTATLALNTWYRIEWTGSGLNSSAGTTTCNVYVGDSATPYITSTYSGQTTTALAGVARYGRNSTTGTNDWLLDNIAQNIGTSTELGPSNSGDAGLDQVVEPGAPVTLVGAGTGSWSQASGAAVTLAGSGATRTFTAPGSTAGGFLTFTFGGDSMTVTVMPPTERVVLGGIEVGLLIYAVS